jgi:hypothetical protein
MFLAAKNMNQQISNFEKLELWYKASLVNKAILLFCFCVFFAVFVAVNKDRVSNDNVIAIFVGVVVVSFVIGIILDIFLSLASQLLFVISSKIPSAYTHENSISAFIRMSANRAGKTMASLWALLEKLVKGLVYFVGWLIGMFILWNIGQWIFIDDVVTDPNILVPALREQIIECERYDDYAACQDVEQLQACLSGVKEQCPLKGNDRF